MRNTIASLLRKEPVNYKGLSFFDLPRGAYASLVEGMADEHRWHFEHNNTESHMAFLRKWGPRMASWSGKLPFPKGSVHLDVGAGEGILSYLVARRGYHSIAVELSATILQSATLFKAGIHGPNSSKDASMELWVADIYDLPLKTGSIDFVTIKQVLHHLDDLDGLMQEVSRVLQPHGIVYLLWEPFFISIPLLRSYYLKRQRRRDAYRKVHHVYHTYWTYQKLFKKWLVEPLIQRDFELSNQKHYITQNRFMNGRVSIYGRIKPYRESDGKPTERLQIQPKDFLCEELIPEGLRTTRCRKEFLDTLP